MAQNYKPYVIQVLLAVVTGGVSALLSGGMTLYDALERPPLSPPGWLFPVAWTVLYILMGVAAGRIQVSGHRDSRKALTAYFIQLAINFLWSPIFFGLGWIGAAAVWLSLLVVAVAATLRRFSGISVAAGVLLWPYLLWCLFALYLNIGLVILN